MKCPECDGGGVVHEHYPCRLCGGTGTLERAADDRASAQRWADALHEEHLREFAWLAGDALTEPVTAEDCGNCQRWGRYAAAVWERVLPR